MFSVTITYAGITPELDRVAMEIARIFRPMASYADSEAFRGTVYDTNVEGWGSHIMPEPFATTSIPTGVALAQFKIAAIGGKATFETASVVEAWYWVNIGTQMASQGFEIEVSQDGVVIFPQPAAVEEPEEPGTPEPPEI